MKTTLIIMLLTSLNLFSQSVDTYKCDRLLLSNRSLYSDQGQIDLRVITLNRRKKIITVKQNKTQLVSKSCYVDTKIKSKKIYNCLREYSRNSREKNLIGKGKLVEVMGPEMYLVLSLELNGEQGLESSVDTIVCRPVYSDEEYP